MSQSQRSEAYGPLRFRRFFSRLGPGLITGAADDDPSGISTYSVTGAAFGYAPLWTALFSFPLMTAVQMMCARLGMVTGEGLAGVIRRHYSRWVLWGACALLVIANTVNIGADLGGMGKVTELMTGINSMYWTPVYAVVIGSFLIWWSYYTIARIFKWMTLILFSYVLAAFFAKPDWGAVLYATFVPHVEWSAKYWATLVGIFGTTISPYLFFWQASQEVEEERKHGALTVKARKGATTAELRKSRNDVITGMFFSNLIMYFIILTTAATLHAHGKTTISTAQDAAEALRPLAGNGAYWLFSLGLIGAGMLGVPVLAGRHGATVHALEVGFDRLHHRHPGAPHARHVGVAPGARRSRTDFSSYSTSAGSRRRACIAGTTAIAFPRLTNQSRSRNRSKNSAGVEAVSSPFRVPSCLSARARAPTQMR